MISLLKKQHWQETSFYMALALYAIFSSPTPDQPGIVELIIACLLFLSIRISGLMSRPVELMCLTLAAAIPLVTSLIMGNNGMDTVRDVIALGFFFLPLFCGKTVSHSVISFQIVLACMGIVFAIRAIIPYADILLSPTLWGQGPPADLMYLANSPEVLFAALWGIKCAFDALMQKHISWKNILSGLVFMFIPLLAMALMMQRAGMMMVGFAVLVYGALLLYRYPLRALSFLPLGILFLAGTWNLWADLLGGLWQKSITVGANGRLAEWGAVWQLTSNQPATLLFGHGWGARFEDPAVGGLPVTYTHSLLSFLLLKSGIIGLLVVIGGIVAGIVRALRRFPFPPYRDLLPLLLPLFIAVFLYASYKSLGFGLILCAFWDNPVRKLEKTDAVVS